MSSPAEQFVDHVLPRDDRFEHDLKYGFNDSYLTSEGVLHVPHVEDPIYVSLGRQDVIQVTPSAKPDTADQTRLYAIRNCLDPNASPVFLDNALRVVGHIGNQALRDVDAVVIGREDTPDLGLTNRVSRRHLSIKASKHGLSFADLDSSNGTTVYLSRFDNGKLQMHARSMVGGRPVEALNKEWSRD
jgi:hypothetical protein